jgi:hypothetical protein
MIAPKYKKNGEIVHNGERYQAIQRLHKKLDDRGIPHDFHELLDGYQICVPKEHRKTGWEGDAVQNFGSYGAEEDLIEVYGFSLEDPDGYLTADEALEYFEKWWAKEKKEAQE